MGKCFVCGKELVQDVNGRYVCPGCGNTQNTIYNDGGTTVTAGKEE